MNVSKGRLNMANISNTVVCDGNDTPSSLKLSNYKNIVILQTYIVLLIVL